MPLEKSAPIDPRWTYRMQPSLPRRSVIIGIAIALLLVAGVFGYWKYGRGIFVPQPDHGKWQAVFLVNGQVYFGKLERIDSRSAVLTNIYYLQVSQALQPPNDSGQQPNINLIKLGEELHGPEDAMYIGRDKVLFWENLKDNSKVVEAIQSRNK